MARTPCIKGTICGHSIERQERAESDAVVMWNRQFTLLRARLLGKRRSTIFFNFDLRGDRANFGYYIGIPLPARVRPSEITIRGISASP